jgi:hypothetical protein
MRHYQRQHQKRARNMGFTMLEMVMALGLMGMLVGMVFQVAQSSMMLSQMVVDEQKTTMERSAFFNLLKHHFEQIPGNAVMRLDRYDASSDRSLFTLTFQNVPMSFNWGETPMTAEALELATVEQRDGFIDVVLRFYDVKILEDSTSTGDEDAEPVAEITLIEDLWHCDCEVVDGSTMEQAVDWDGNKLPLQVKFYCRFEPAADLVEQTFWVVPKENPEVFMRQVMQKNPGGPQVPEGGTTPGTPKIEINPGTGSPALPGKSRGTRGTNPSSRKSNGGPMPQR